MKLLNRLAEMSPITATILLSAITLGLAVLLYYLISRGS